MMWGEWSRHRLNVIKDEIVVKGSGDMVNKVSMAMYALIVMTSAFQVFFVRRLFKVVNVSPSGKPRA